MKPTFTPVRKVARPMNVYGLDADDFGDAYEIEFSATVSGSEGEDTQEMEMGFVEYKGVWYAAEALLEGF